MKPEDIRKLSDEQLRRKIAEKFGWKWRGYRPGEPNWSSPDGRRILNLEPPNYATDLNAMHEAERGWLFPDDVLDSYKRSLYRVMLDDNDKRDMMFATARQRAMAFVQVKS
jgi:hypothetical protein